MLPNALMKSPSNTCIWISSVLASDSISHVFSRSFDSWARVITYNSVSSHGKTGWHRMCGRKCHSGVRAALTESNGGFRLGAWCCRTVERNPGGGSHLRSLPADEAGTRVCETRVVASEGIASALELLWFSAEGPGTSIAEVTVGVPKSLLACGASQSFHTGGGSEIELAIHGSQCPGVRAWAMGLAVWLPGRLGCIFVELDEDAGDAEDVQIVPGKGSSSGTRDMFLFGFGKWRCVCNIYACNLYRTFPHVL